jgi:hypothetical protein
MSIRQQVTFEDISKALNISKERYEHIVSYVYQMIKDYRGNAADIVKEIRLNLKGNERYLTIYMIGNSSSFTFLRSTDKQKSEFISSITNALKFDQEGTVSVAQHMIQIILEDIDNNVPTIDTIKKIINGNFMDTEKEYMLFSFGLAGV